MPDKTGPICQLGQTASRHVVASESRSTRPMQLIHSDLGRSLPDMGIGQVRYDVGYLDDLTTMPLYTVEGGNRISWQRSDNCRQWREHNSDGQLKRSSFPDVPASLVSVKAKNCKNLKKYSEN